MIIDEYRAAIYKYVGQNETLENEIIRIITEKFNKLRHIFEQNGINPEIIDEYMDGNMSMLKLEARRMSDGRKEDILGQFDSIVRKIENQLEETEDKEDHKKIEQRNIDEMSSIETDDILYARRIAGQLADNLDDIRSHANKILDYREVDFSKIQDVLEDIRVYVSKVREVSEEEIYGALENDKRDIIETLTSEYEKALDTMAQIADREERSKEEDFKGRLDAGITLKKQSEFAIQWAEVEDDEKGVKEEKEEKKPSLGEGIELI